VTETQILYVIGAPPALFFPVYYTITARWWKSREGLLFMLMALLPFSLYLSVIVFLAFPGSELRDLLRIVFGTVAAVASWSTILLYVVIRREGLQRRKDKIKKER
jgi:hypothetical protein